MQPHAHLAWPFFDESHRALGAAVEAWAARELGGDHGGDLDARCRDHVRRLGAAGWLRHVVPAAFGGERERVDVRSLSRIGVGDLGVNARRVRAFIERLRTEGLPGS